MTDTPGRLLTLLSLLQTPREWPGTELAARLAVSTRTIRRDIDRLRGLGYPVESTMGAEGGYRLVAGAAMPPLLLDDEEAVAIAVGLRTAARQAVAGIDEASARALAKLEQVLPSRLRRRVRTLGAATVPMPDPGPPVVPEDLAALAAAIANHERVRFGYRDAEGRESRRLAEPHRLVAAGRRWYLVAWDVDRDDWRLFRVDRVRRPHGTGARTTPRELPADDAAAFVTAKLNRTVPTHRAVVTLHAPLAEMRPRVENAGELTATGPAACRLETHADTLDWLAFRLLALGCEFEVHEPPELAAHLRALAGRITRATSG
ncbi:MULTISPECIES: YafY family protein [unclassified Amycolatopsis]|uniref:helix-turn-helix transcriptional regulator n=1 Tax=unclassified Amycolatopsis TaxID=2618356 RepID=UPI00026291BD|nr:YafY family protein [Amycolatopsis sp. ATCC 39116]